MPDDKPKPDRFPWYPHYVADWRLSRSVRQMTYEQRGMYRELMDVAWGTGITEPHLVDDDKWIATELGIPLSRWRKVGPAIRACWDARDGKLYSPRLSKAWEIQRAKYELRAMAGREGGKAKALALANRKQMPSNATRLPVTERKHTDAESDRTKSSSAPTPLGALTDGALASAIQAKRA